MTMFLLGLRLSLRPFWPWKPIESGWLSMLFVHMLVKVNPTALSSSSIRVTTNDETKRRSLQPGSRTPSEALPRATSTPRAIVPAKEVVAAPQITLDQTKQRTLQPRGEDQALVEVDALKGKSFAHRFYGSALMVGTRTLMSGLSVGMHHLEITTGGQVFIDNNPYAVNPSDLVMIKAELSKVVR